MPQLTWDPVTRRRILPANPYERKARVPLGAAAGGALSTVSAPRSPGMPLYPTTGGSYEQALREAAAPATPPGMTPPPPAGSPEFRQWFVDEIARRKAAALAPGTIGTPGPIGPSWAPTGGTPVPTGPGATTNPLAPAAQLLGGSMAGAYGVHPRLLEQLKAGRLPSVGLLGQGFWSRLSPILQQSLTGLYESGGYLPEELDWTRRRFAPTGPGYVPRVSF